MQKSDFGSGWRFETLGGSIEALSLPSELQPRITNGSRHVIDTGGTPAQNDRSIWACNYATAQKAFYYCRRNDTELHPVV